MMVRKLRVILRLNNELLLVGELVLEGRSVYFRYDPEFVASGMELSPFKLKLTDQIKTADPVPFDGLFGLFADSLPDGWGQLLLDRKLTAEGMAIESLTPLDRLAFVGDNGMGALTYEPAIGEDLQLGDLPELDRLAAEMHVLLQGTPTEIIDELYQLGGSSGGARPKINVGYSKQTGNLMYGLPELPDGYEHWLIKFPAAIDRKDVAQIEFAYYKMALAAGLEMAESRLFEGKGDRFYFGTKRFDRRGNQRLHMHSVSGLLHDNFRLSSLDYGHIMDAAFRLEKHVQSYTKILRLAAFNVFAHNRDDHSKNFSFLMDKTGNWKFAPAYDLTFSNSSHGFHSTMVAGESQAPGAKHLLELANHFRVKNPHQIIDEVREAVSNWDLFADEAGVSNSSKRLIGKQLDQLLTR
ncbi:MAG: type II toxin-antitoxin system HipA family toxin [Fluviicola sp.]|nr:type II toxin-antitoxin system HipA family toxin [Fluviicola sp.]